MTVEELNRDKLIAAMKRCGIRVVMWSRTDPRDDYDWHGPGWFIGTNTRGDGVGFYIRDEDVTVTIIALMKLKRGAYDDAVMVLEAVCAERKAETKE